MALRAFIGSTELDLPNDFTLPVSLHSPIYNFKEFRIGDFTMNIKFPLTPRNRVAFQFADELAIAEKQLEYPDFRIEEGGEIKAFGFIEMVEAIEQNGTGFIDTNFFTLLLPYDIKETKLSDAVTKIVPLGGNTAATISAAHALNNINLSADGVTGSVLRFYPTLAEDFYGDTNADWWPDANKYKLESNYAKNDVVKFRLPEFINEYDVPSDTQFAIVERYFQVISESDPAIADGETPFSHSEKWSIITPGILNHPNGITFYGNTDWDAELETINRHALLPYIQLHDIIREVAKSLGYQVKGEYMADPKERLVTFQSNLALDKGSGNPNYAAVVDSTVYEVLNEGNAVPTRFKPDDENGINVDPFDLWQNYLSFPGLQDYKPQDSGTYLINIRVRVLNTLTETRSFRIKLYSGEPDGLGGDFAVFERFFDVPGGELLNLEVTEIETLPNDRRYYIRYEYSENTEWSIQYATVEFKNVLTDFVNIYEGNVRYADHMPDLTVAEFLNAVKLWKNLFPIWDYKSRILYLDYTENRLKDNKNLVEMGDFKDMGKLNRMLAKKRFLMNYGELPDVFEPLNGFEELEPVNSASLLPAPNAANKYILVKNENAYYFTKEYDYGGRLYWAFGGYAWNDLQVEEQGDLLSIIPKMGPVPVKRYHGHEGEFLAPVYEGAGRSAMYHPGGDRPPLRVISDIGIMSQYSGGYRYGNTIGLTQSGSTAPINDMSWHSIFQINWKRTLQMLVLEEITTNLYRFPPDKKQLINFARIFLLGHVPVIPIKTTEAIGGDGLMEIEARKVKSVEVTVVGEGQGDVISDFSPLSIADLALFLDGADSATIIDDAPIYQWNDRSLLANDAVQSNPSLQATYELLEKGWRVNNTGFFLNNTIFLENHYEIWVVLKRVGDPSTGGVLGYFLFGDNSTQGISHCNNYAGVTDGVGSFRTSGYYSGNNELPVNTTFVFCFDSEGVVLRNNANLPMSVGTFNKLTEIKKIGFRNAANLDLNGYVKSVSIVNGSLLSTEDRGLMYDYMIGRYT